MPPMANHGRSGLPSRRGGPGRARRPGGPVWSGWPSRGRCRSSRPRLGRRASAACARIVRGTADQPPRRRRSGGPADRQVVLAQVQHVAPAASATSARSFTANSAPWRRHASAIISRAASSSGVPPAGLVAQLDDVHAAGQRRVDELGEVARCRAGRRCTGTAARRPAGRLICSAVHLATVIEVGVETGPHGSPGTGLRGGRRARPDRRT